MTWKLLQGDCRFKMSEMRPNTYDLIFADPPFGIGYDYDLHNDNVSRSEYLNFTQLWMYEAKRVLSDTGSLWIMIGDEYAAEIRMKIREFKLHLRNWVVWYYSFGQACQNKFSRSHCHLFYCTKDAKNFIFNADSVRVPSDRQTIYNDARANPLGKLPDDTWLDTRICGTFRERTKHPCQIPETILNRIVLGCTNIQDKILDPFAGSGTTLAVGHRLGRDVTGIELSPGYCEIIRERMS